MNVTERSMAASAVVFDQYREMVLLVWDSLISQWRFPRASVRAGEAPDECAVRAVLEDTGIRVFPWETLPAIPGGSRRPAPIVVCDFPAGDLGVALDLRYLVRADVADEVVDEHLDGCADARWFSMSSIHRDWVRSDVVPMMEIVDDVVRTGYGW